MTFARTGGPGKGLFFGDHIVQAVNRSGATTGIGEVVMFDMAQGATETDNGTPGSTDTSGPNSSYNSYVDPSIAAATRHFIFGIALESIADDTSGRIQISGRCTAKVAAATVAGTALVANADGEMDVQAGTGDSKVIAIAEEADTANLAAVLFDGMNGFGWDVTSG